MTGDEQAAPSRQPQTAAAEVLAAERAGVEYWVGVAGRRGAEYEALRGRLAVRAILAFGRVIGPPGERAGRLVRGWVVAGRRRMLAARSLPGRRRRLDQLSAGLAGTAPPTSTSSGRSITVIIAGRQSDKPTILANVGNEISVLRVSNCGDATDLAGGVARALAAANTELVCIVASSVSPREEHWLDELRIEIEGAVAMVTPCVLHAVRRWPDATPYDLLVREAGLEVQPTSEGGSVLRFRAAGAAVDSLGDGDGADVVSASATCVVFDRKASAEVGGLKPNCGLDAAVVDLSVRLRANGFRVRSSWRTVVFDDRHISHRRELVAPLADDGLAWRWLVEQHGPRLLARVGRENESAGRRRVVTFTLTVATPSAKVAQKWGDWHLAEGLAGALRRAGHEVRVQTADQADSLAGRMADVHLVLRGLAPVRATPGQRQVLWVISHPEALTSRECDDADLVLVASPRFAESLRARTSTPVEVLLQATDPDRFRPRPPDSRHQHRVTIVAKSRDVMRPMVADAIEAGLRPAIYGAGWEGLVDPALIVSPHVRNEELAAVYSSAGVVLNDHWDSMREWGFVSNRVFDVLACGTPLVSDYLPELAELFGDLVPTWSTVDQLKAVVDEIFADPAATAQRSLAARNEVLGSHTFARRAEELLRVLGAHRLIGNQRSG